MITLYSLQSLLLLDGLKCRLVLALIVISIVRIKFETQCHLLKVGRQKGRLTAYIITHLLVQVLAGYSCTNVTELNQLQ